MLEEFQADVTGCGYFWQIFGGDDHSVWKCDITNLTLFGDDVLSHHMAVWRDSLMQLHIGIIGKKPLDFLGLLHEKQQFGIA